MFYQSKIEENIDIKNPFKNKNLPTPFNSTETVSQLYVYMKLTKKLYEKTLKKSMIGDWIEGIKNL